MAKFQIYNVQVLPIKDGVKEIGVAGYKRLFRLLESFNFKHLKSGSEGSIHFRLSSDVFIGPDKIKTAAGVVYGNFVRYRKTEKVRELASKRTLYKAGAKTAVSDANELAFVFDPQNHLLAIEVGGRFPPAEKFSDWLANILTGSAGDNWPDHELTVNVVSNSAALDEVFKTAKAYKYADIELTFLNGSDVEDILDSMRADRVRKLELKASAGKSGTMPDLPPLVKSFLKYAAEGLGTAIVSFFVESKAGDETKLRKKKYDSRQSPLTFQVNRTSADQDPTDFAERVKKKMRSVSSIAIHTENP
ncbi:DUF4747 family protein [Bordetella sp. 02P26C-1]|uniref:DUF4747 family protein n=1 Tax=Bordetella sp. 02P26C-1 TaxID=2683195 RepID=UPI001353D024|nr:DUF4747 family protein [Bordetella sp. 02P26C-1]MVW80193.1 DUF4747 family protein [Bordetella sp. 02P26C-1]